MSLLSVRSDLLRIVSLLNLRYKLLAEIDQDKNSELPRSRYYIQSSRVKLKEHCCAARQPAITKIVQLEMTGEWLKAAVSEQK